MLEEMENELRSFMMANWSQTQIKEYCAVAEFKDVKPKDMKDPLFFKRQRYHRLLRDLKIEYENYLTKKKKKEYENV